MSTRPTSNNLRAPLNHGRGTPVISSAPVAPQVTTGAAAEYKDLKLILAHAGAFIPYVASRIGMAATAIGGGGLAQAGVSDASIEPLKRFYVDTALSSELSSVIHASSRILTLPFVLWMGFLLST